MHSSAMELGRVFFDHYLQDTTKSKVLEIGSFDVNGSLRDALGNRDVDYVGVDFAEGKNVDVVLDDPYNIPFEDSSFDIIVSSSSFEHSEFFWLSWLEILRLVKPGGKIYINVPFNGYVHRYPVDCWRFYPDAGIALQNWGRVNNYPVALLESFVAKQFSSEDEGRWNDFVAVFTKSDSYDDVPSRMSTSISDDINHLIQNGERCGDDFGLPQDFVIQDELKVELARLHEDSTKALSDLDKIIEASKHANTELKKELVHLREDNIKTCNELVSIKQNKIYKIMKTLRIFK